jgi:serine/threonine protein kinase
MPAVAPVAGRYLLVDQIAVGGMGSVWRAWDFAERRWVAAKVLGRHDSALLQRFVREQSLRIRHAHVVAPTGWAADDHRMLFTMDLVRGGSLDGLLARHGPLPDSFVRVLLDQTLQALVAVHAAGVVHRDVKPGNLLLEATGTGRPWVRLGDFGVAAVLDDVRLTQVPGVIGTRGYLPPEHAEGGVPDPRQDLYAAGVVAAQLLTGCPPRAGEPCPVPPGPMQPLLAALTAPDSHDRPVSAADALVRLRAIGVPAGAPWRADPHPPDVVDVLDPEHVGAMRGWAVAAVGCFAAATLLGALAAWLLVR